MSFYIFVTVLLRYLFKDDVLITFIHLTLQLALTDIKGVRKMNAIINLILCLVCADETECRPNKHDKGELRLAQESAKDKVT